jgi:hypothetical protein
MSSIDFNTHLPFRNGFRNLKFRVTSQEHSKQIQEMMFKKGYQWVFNGKSVSNKEKPYLFANNRGQITFGENMDIFQLSGNQEVTFPVEDSFKKKDMKEHPELRNMKFSIKNKKTLKRLLKHLVAIGYHHATVSKDFLDRITKNPPPYYVTASTVGCIAIGIAETRDGFESIKDYEEMFFYVDTVISSVSKEDLEKYVVVDGTSYDVQCVRDAIKAFQPALHKEKPVFKKLKFNLKSTVLPSDEIQYRLFHFGYTWPTGIRKPQFKPFSASYLYAHEDGILTFGGGGSSAFDSMTAYMDMTLVTNFMNSEYETQLKVKPFFNQLKFDLRNVKLQRETIEQRLFQLGYEWQSMGKTPTAGIASMAFLYANANGFLTHGVDRGTFIERVGYIDLTYCASQF